MKSKVDYKKAWEELEQRFKKLHRKKRKGVYSFYLFVWEILEIMTEILKQCTKQKKKEEDK